MKYNILWDNILIAKIEGNEYFPDKEAIENASGLLRPLVLSENNKIPKYILHRIMLDPDCKNKSQLNTDKLTIEKVG